MGGHLMTNNEFRLALGKQLAALRLDNKTLAKRYGVSAKTVERWLSGDTCPEPNTRAAIILQLERDLEDRRQMWFARQNVLRNAENAWATAHKALSQHFEEFGCACRTPGEACAWCDPGG